MHLPFSFCEFSFYPSHISDMPTLEEQFRAAVEIVQSLPKEGPIQTSIDDKLKAYALFKQATIGPCNAPKPPLYYLIERIKWNAWNALGEMEKEEAMQRYVDYFLSKCDEAEKEYPVLEWVTDPKHLQLASTVKHLIPTIQKDFEILGRTTVKGLEGRSFDIDGVPVNL